MPAILHIDMDAFFAAVEQREHPEWRGKPVIVGAPPDKRGVVSTCSYEARRFGVHSAMPSRTAAKLCPDGIFVPCNFPLYERVSAQVIAIFDRFTPFVEQVSIDEAFLDVTGSQLLFGDGETIARKIRAAIRDELNLTASVGVATNRFLAKIASDMHKPDGLTVVPSDRAGIIEFLAPLPVGALRGVGAATKEILHNHGFFKVADIQCASMRQLSSTLGAHLAEYLIKRAFGEDDSGGSQCAFSADDSAPLSISREHTFPEDTRDRRVLEETLSALADDVSSRLRAQNLLAATVRLKLRWSNFKTITRQAQLPRPSSDTFTIAAAARGLFARETLASPIRLIGFALAGLAPPGSISAPQQLDLFAPPPTNNDSAPSKNDAVSAAIDKIRGKFGNDSLKIG